MEEKEVIEVDKSKERILRIIFKSGTCEDFYRVVQIDYDDEDMIISHIGYEDKLIKHIFKNKNILSYRIEFTNSKVVLVGDEEDGE